nr:hypothetical protein [Tanacetum cinerariifolium]
EEKKQIEEEQAANARYWMIPACYDDDDDDYTFAITLKEPDNSLRINEIDCDPEEEIHFIKRLLYDNSSPQINLSFTLDKPMPPGIKEDDYDSEGDILILEELLGNDSLSFPKNKSFYFDIPSSSGPPVKPPDGNTGILNVKVMGDIFEHKVPMPRLMFTQSTIVPNQEKSPVLLSHRGHEAFRPSTECPKMIYGKNTPILDVLFFHFYPP